MPPHCAQPDLEDNLEPPPSAQVSLARKAGTSRRRALTGNNARCPPSLKVGATRSEQLSAPTPHVIQQAHAPEWLDEHKNEHEHKHEHKQNNHAPTLVPSSGMTSSTPNPSDPNLANPLPKPKSSTTPTKAAPAARTFFDPWNSSSTGHQRAANRLSGSTSWRQSRNLKLGEQYKAGLGGGKRLADTVGAGSENFGKDGRKENGGWERGASGLRSGGQKSLMEAWGAKKNAAKPSSQEKSSNVEEVEAYADQAGVNDDAAKSEVEDNVPQHKQIFANLCFYLNGSTAPLISDHKLKRLLALHGGNMSIALGRRTVTHVILGSTSSSGGCGGSLASSKIHKEVTKTGGKSVKYVTAEWVLECIKVGRRVPESRFPTLKLAPKGQNSVLGMMSRSASAEPQND